MTNNAWNVSGTGEFCASNKRCTSYLPGHTVHWIHFKQSVQNPSEVLPVTARADDSGLVHVDGEDVSLVRWHHRPDLLWDALNAFGGTAVWKPRWHLLAVPTDAAMGSARTVFSLAGLGRRDL